MYNIIFGNHLSHSILAYNTKRADCFYYINKLVPEVSDENDLINVVIRTRLMFKRPVCMLYENPLLSISRLNNVT